MSSKSLGITLLLFMLSSNSLFESIIPVEEGVYDVGPSRVFFVHVIASDNYKDYIYVIGLSDNTRVSIYDITDPDAATLVSEGTVNKEENFLFKATFRKYYKIITDKPVVAWLVGGSAHNWPENNYGGCGGSTFYPSVEGSYVGREFIYIAGGTYYYTTGTGSAWLGTDVYTQIPPASFETKVYSIQQADIKVYNASGALLYQFSMGPDMCKSFPSTCMVTYHVVSTGDIILQCAGGGNCFTIAPSTNGNLVGKIHYGSTFAWQRGCFLCISYEAGDVNVYDVDTGVLLYEHNFSGAGEYWYRGGLGIVTVRPGFNLEMALEQAAHANNVGTRNLRFESTANIMVYIGDTESSYYDDDSPKTIGDDLAFAGGIDAKEFYVYAPTYLIIFAPSDVHLTINGTSQDLKANHYLNLAGSALYHIVSDKPIIVEVEGLGTGAAATANDYAEYLLSFPDIPATSPEISIKSTFDITTVIVGAIVTLVVVISIIIIRNKMKRA